MSTKVYFLIGIKWHLNIAALIIDTHIWALEQFSNVLRPLHWWLSFLFDTTLRVEPFFIKYWIGYLIVFVEDLRCKRLFHELILNWNMGRGQKFRSNHHSIAGICYTTWFRFFNRWSDRVRTVIRVGGWMTTFICKLAFDWTHWHHIWFVRNTLSSKIWIIVQQLA